MAEFKIKFFVILSFKERSMTGLQSIYPLSKQGYILRKQIFPDVYTGRLDAFARAGFTEGQKLIPVFKPGDMLYEIGIIGHPFHTSNSTYAPQSIK